LNRALLVLSRPAQGTDMLSRRALPKPKIDQPRDLPLFVRWLLKSGFVWTGFTRWTGYEPIRRNRHANSSCSSWSDPSSTAPSKTNYEHGEEIQRMVAGSRATEGLGQACTHRSHQRPLRRFGGKPRLSPRPVSSGGSRRRSAGGISAQDHRAVLPQAGIPAS
jgi:hypothetical protein